MPQAIMLEPGTRFHWLTVIKYHGVTTDPSGRKRRTYLCRCDCGKERVVLTELLRNGYVKSCGCTRAKPRREYTKGNKHPAWKGYQEIPRTLWWSIEQNARARNLAFEISIEYAWELYQVQEGRCKLSGLPIKFMTGRYDNGHYYNSASLDRIDSSKGYVEGNVQWVDQRINMMKKHYPQAEFIELCKAVAQTQTRTA